MEEGRSSMAHFFQKKAGLIYQLFIVSLIILSLFLLDNSSTWANIVQWLIWLIFVLDYGVQLIRAENKKTFLRTHFLEALSVIPFLHDFRVFKLISVLHYVGYLSKGLRHSWKIYNMLLKYFSNRLVIGLVITILVVPFIMFLIEPGFTSYREAIWWCIQTVSTVGYGDVIPNTQLGRLIAGFMMLIGISILGAFSGVVSEYFRGKKKNDFDGLVKSIANVETLTKEQKKLLKDLIDTKK